MRNATNVMYKIGKVFNIIGVVLSAILIIAGIVVIAGVDIVVSESASEQDAALLVAAGAIYLVIGIIELVVQIISLVLVGKAKAELDGGNGSKKMQIVMIVFGAIGCIFYLLGGIFGIVTISSEYNNGGNIEGNNE